MSCKFNQKLEEKYAPTNNEILVLLKPRANVGDLEMAFKDYDLKSKGRSSRSKNQFRMIFDASKISVDKLVKELSAHPSVLEVSKIEVVTKPRVTNG